MKETKLYPLCCTSMYCGREDCKGCESKPIKDDFESWRERTNAYKPDPIWCPRVWRSREKDRLAVVMPMRV